ncbi:hypothetical protein FKP32DRAFT_1189612 [Trametes sanguinea]|nr:hypothetical protein FKP32DRAFT_1189612 [Trametes sanguinea]
MIGPHLVHRCRGYLPVEHLAWSASALIHRNLNRGVVWPSIGAASWLLCPADAVYLHLRVDTGSNLERSQRSKSHMAHSNASISCVPCPSPPPPTTGLCASTHRHISPPVSQNGGLYLAREHFDVAHAELGPFTVSYRAPAGQFNCCSRASLPYLICPTNGCASHGT